MSKDRVQDALIEALQQALADPAEQRLYRAGKLAGLFSGRGGLGGEAAARALRDGLLEIVRTEVKGKTTIEWARITPRGIDFLHDHESPVQVLRELRELLKQNQAALPDWLAAMRQTLQVQAERLDEELGRWTHHLQILSRRVEDTLQRLAPPPPDEIASVDWAGEALSYLDRRRNSGAPGDCALPELFAAVRQHSPHLTVSGFHDGLLRLHEHKALRLVSFTGPPNELTEPEFALVDGTELIYYARR